MRKGWMPRAKVLLSKLDGLDDQYWSAWPPLEYEEVDYADATPEQEREIEARVAAMIEQRRRETAGGAAFISAWWAPVSAWGAAEDLLARLADHVCGRESAALVARSTVIWGGTSEWESRGDDGASPGDRMRGIIQLRTCAPARQHAALSNALRELGGLLIKPPPAYVDRCVSRFPQSTDQTVEFRGAAWLLASSLETQTPGLPPVAHVATELLDRPVAARRLLFSTSDWRELYARVRRSVRESDGTSVQWPGVFVPSSRLLFQPEGRVEGEWLPSFRANTTWVLQPRLIEFIPSTLDLLRRAIKPVLRDQPKDLVTKAKAARALSIGVSTIFRWVQNKEVASYGATNKVSLREVAALVYGSEACTPAFMARLSAATK